ncbi:hypothetical protein [Algivirga pacifica]|uniref:DUF1653 domain-containing protein n=1 Tax=Algivirga pacifica TaxID=1162670 RepID=A0ABP9D0T3_9BACT
MNNAPNIFYKGYKIHKDERHYLVLGIYDMSEHSYEIVRFAHSMDEAKTLVDQLIKKRLSTLFERFQPSYQAL